MKLRWIGLAVINIAIFLSASTVNAAPCDMGITSCSHYQGTGSNIVMNTMPYSRTLYIYNTNTCLENSDLITGTTSLEKYNNTNDCLIFPGQSIGTTTNNLTDDDCDFAHPTYGCPCFENQCVINRATHPRLITENEFTSIRRCNGNSCDTRDPLGYFPGHDNYETLPTYSKSINGTLAIGDRIRVMVYTHNNATEQFPGQTNYNNYMAHGVTPAITWTGNTITGSVSSTNAGNRTSPGVTIPSLPSGTHLEVLGAWHHYNTGSTGANFNLTATNRTPADAALTVTDNSAAFSIGDHASCFGNIHRVYFDLEVQETPSQYELIKSCSPDPGTPVSPGDIITYILTLTNNGNSTPATMTIVDLLDPGLTYLTGDIGVEENAGVVDISVPNLAPGAPVSYSFDVEVSGISNGTSSICNEAAATDGTIDALSNEVCHAMPLVLHKEATLPETTILQPGMVFSYLLSLTNNTGTNQTITVSDPLDSNLIFSSTNTPNPNITYISSTHTVDITFDSVAPGDTQTHEIIVEVGDITTEITICNQASNTAGPPAPANDKKDSTPNTGPATGPTTETPPTFTQKVIDSFRKAIKFLTGSLFSPYTIDQLKAQVIDPPIPVTSEEVCHTATPPSTGLVKSVTGGTITNSTPLTYTIRFTSLEETPITSTFTDDLDTSLVYVGNETITTSDDTVITGTITHDGAATGGTITMEANDVPENGWIEYTFDVIVTPTEAVPDEICNQAYDLVNSWYSNIICSPKTTGSTGPAQTISTIGICADLANGSLTCRKHTPHRSFGETEFTAWKDCKKLDNTNEGIKACTRTWAENVGLLALGECHPDNITSNQTVGYWQHNNGNLYTNLPDHVNECDTTIINNCNTVASCAEIDATITKDVDTPAVAQDENAQYSINLNLKRSASAEPTDIISITGMKVYDLTIPTGSGWLWDHVLESSTPEWEWKGTPDDPATNYFEWVGVDPLDPLDDEFYLNTDLDIPLFYEMNTGLTIESDTAKVKNVAFAVIEYEITSFDAAGNPSTRLDSFHLGDTNNPDEICNTVFLSEVLGSKSTVGATAEVQIVRPYVEVRGGGNIGVQTMTDTSHIPFGGLITGNSLNVTISTGETFTQGETEILEQTNNTTDQQDELRNDADDTEDLLGTTWDTTFDDSGVYFTDQDVILNQDSILNGDFTESKTFIINGTLTITEDFQPTGFGAFIADDIIIHSTVKNITGIFIADPGTITSDLESEHQLVITGALMGDATQILEKRNYIGADPMNQLEPSIKINYDLRLLDETPPALELFLSEDWTQTAE